MTKRTLLLVDDDEVYRKRLARSLAERDLDVIEARSCDDALHILESHDMPVPQLAVLDVRMPGGSGIDVLRALMRRGPNTRAVVLTGWGSIPNAIEAVRLGASDYLTKPASADEILAALDGKRVQPDADAPSLDRVEWEHIQRVLTARDGNVSQAARALGLQRRSLQRKLAKLPAPR